MLDGYTLYNKRDGKNCIVIRSDTLDEMLLVVERLTKSRDKNLKEIGNKLLKEINGELND